MSPAEPPLTARWSKDGRKVRPGRDAQKFLDAEAVKHGIDPMEIRRCIAKDEPAGRMLLSMLGLRRQDVVPRGRPPDLQRLMLIRGVVDSLRDAGKSEDEAFRSAPRYLADPRLRARDRIGWGEAVVHGKGPDKPPLSHSAVRAAYRKYHAEAPSIFFDVIDD
ncbi:MAG: hypothetical protein ACAH20_12330 [Methylobacteriaceae bacterium]